MANPTDTATQASTSAVTADTGSAGLAGGGGDSGEILGDTELTMPQLVGVTVDEVRAALGDYPVSYLDKAGVPVAVAAVAGGSTVCVQQPAAGVPLAGDTATLTIAQPADSC